ncbi:MAG: 3-keto-5-aminohexanoate cleavage protein [Deltaproteobacteria bacterium]|nr:3-keto-5-aminohexanoate cleavage protein [Deltaproteobacteria bacterium]MCB9789252.1 3-keto-5-aminohexanoate cleavage protein [Deltaproteobacteria bacterium]
MSDPTAKAVVTCALTGVLTDPERHHVPVTPEQMAAEARRAADAGATVVHVHFRRQEEGRGHLPSWEPEVAGAICDAIRAEVPELLINMSTGVVGDDIRGPVACLERVRPEMAALNAGSLNYLKTRADGSWAWPPMLFDNPVAKVKGFVEAMDRLDVVPECECFDTGILRSVGLFLHNGLLRPPVHVSLVMGVASGMPARADWLPLLLDELPAGAHWQAIAIGREEVWDVHRRAAELGGHLRTGLEDTFYLPDGERATSNGQLIEALVKLARESGRDIAGPEDARAVLRA